jgi:peptidoglycan/xylan/chitin deacetylase (PgdA/CDA1 family)
LKIGGIEQREAGVLELIDQSGGQPLPDRLFGNAEEIRSLHQRGLTVASHSRDHAILSRESPTAQAENLAENQAFITDLVGRPARVLAYPNGDENDSDVHTQAAAKAAGHDYACTLVRAFAKPVDDPFRVRRMSVKPWWPVNKFALRMIKTLQWDHDLRRGAST